MAGNVIGLKSGESVTVGREAGRVQFALPHDTFMSGIHFAVECGPQGCHVQDRKSSNGTFLNGARIQHAMLANGDEIKGGQTIFAVKIVPDAKLASLLPPREVEPAPTPQQRPPAAEPAVPSSPDQRPRAAEPPPPAAGRASIKGAPGLPPPAGPPIAVADPPPQAKRTADLGEASDSRPAPDVAVDAAARKYRGAPEPPPARGLPPRPEVPAKSVPPPVEEPPRFHAIPSLPRPGNPPNVAAPNASANLPRVTVPPAGVAPYIAQKFAEEPGARGGVGARGAAFSVMGWSFPAAPAEWQVQEGFGLQQSGHEGFPSSVAATEELLGGITLQQFVESQISMLRGYLRDPKIEPTMPPRVGGADESMAVDVRHSTKDGRELVYRRIYARSGSSVGVLTVTTLAADFPQVLETLQALLDGAAFRATVNN
jgi:pSer/pThr/pTyr-binding forkhead associated (FHA) protein